MENNLKNELNKKQESSADNLYKRLKRDIDNIIKNKKSIYDIL